MLLSRTFRDAGNCRATKTMLRKPLLNGESVREPNLLMVMPIFFRFLHYRLLLIKLISSFLGYGYLEFHDLSKKSSVHVVIGLWIQ